jgi:hypothetical protein
MAKNIGGRIFLGPKVTLYNQKQAHPSTAKEGNTDPEAVFPLIELRREKVPI